MKTPHQKTVMAILELQTDWITVATLSNMTGIQESNMRNILRQKSFNFLEKGVMETRLKSGGKYVRVYRLPQHTASTEQALALSKEYQGMFGQLFWSKKTSNIKLMP